MKEERQAKRALAARLPRADATQLVLLTGARQTGKTTLVKGLYDLPYYNLDALEYRDQLASVSSFSWSKTVGAAVLDEVQKEPLLFDKIKYAHDSGELPFSVLLGSAQILLMKRISESMAGRILVYELFPLMLSEVLSLSTGELDPPILATLLQGRRLDDICASYPEVLLGEKYDAARHAEDYLLQWGGMPRLLHLDDSTRMEWLKSYERTYLERDLGDLARLSDLRPFRQFQKVTALRAGHLLSFSELARDTGIAVETARRYLEYLRISYQAFLVPPFTRNATSRLIKSPKLYWTDVGLLRSMTGQAGSTVLSGELFENYVASELIKYMRTSGSEAILSTYRTRSGMEIDFMLEMPQGIVGLEVKARETVTGSDATSMRRVAEALGKDWLGGLTVYRGNKIQRLSPGIWAIPSYRLFGT